MQVVHCLAGLLGAGNLWQQDDTRFSLFQSCDLSYPWRRCASDTASCLRAILRPVLASSRKPYSDCLSQTRTRFLWDWDRQQSHRLSFQEDSVSEKPDVVHFPLTGCFSASDLTSSSLASCLSSLVIRKKLSFYFYWHCGKQALQPFSGVQGVLDLGRDFNSGSDWYLYRQLLLIAG